MGKKQHSKDRMFITSTEWAIEWGGAKRASNTTFKKLPFNCCALTFTPFEEPVCTDEGHVFDILHIVPYLQKFGKNPVTGKPLSLKGLHKLTFHKNSDGEFQCPVLNKVFTEFTHIVAIKTTGNVFCYDAIKELNIKAKNWKELLTDEPFTRADIITIQDPNKESSRLLDEFDFVKKDISLSELGIGGGGDASEGLNLKAAGAAVQRTLKELPTAGAAALRLGGGGGGGKAQREAAAALAALEAKKAEQQRKREEKEQRERALLGRNEQREEQGKGKGEQGKEQREEEQGEEQKGVSKGEASGSEGPEKDKESDAGKKKDKGKQQQQAEKERRKKKKEEEAEAAPPAMSVVDAASASVAGRSANAAKASDEKKTKAKVAAHAAGERVPVAENSRWVQSKYTSGATSRSFTSTTYTPVTKTEYEMVQVEKNPKKKGYCRVHTSHGDLNLELHCDLAPRTCENFLTLASRGYYNGTVFHRSIRNFMIQGGDPTGTGKGGQSIWGKPFKDELDARLTHSERGVLSMANSGPHSNGSQFFVLYKSAPHLNFKHTVFGRVVGGLETLTKMERVPVDDDDRPHEDITITEVSIFVNPYLEEDEEDEKDKVKQKELTFAERQEQEKVGSWFSNPTEGSATLEAKGGGIGKYLKRSAIESAPSGIPSGTPADTGVSEQKAKVARIAPSQPKVKYGNFDVW